MNLVNESKPMKANKPVLRLDKPELNFTSQDYYKTNSVSNKYSSGKTDQFKMKIGQFNDNDKNKHNKLTDYLNEINGTPVITRRNTFSHKKGLTKDTEIEEFFKDFKKEKKSMLSKYKPNRKGSKLIDE